MSHNPSRAARSIQSPSHLLRLSTCALLACSSLSVCAQYYVGEPAPMIQDYNGNVVGYPARVIAPQQQVYVNVPANYAQPVYGPVYVQPAPMSYVPYVPYGATYSYGYASGYTPGYSPTYNSGAVALGAAVAGAAVIAGIAIAGSRNSGNYNQRNQAPHHHHRH